MLRHTLASLTAALALALAAACASTPAEPSVSGRLRVATTIYPVTFFAQQVGGDLVEVTGLVSPGTEPHAFEPSPSDILTIQAADVVVYNSRAFETWITDALDAIDARPRTVVEAADLDLAQSAEPVSEHEDEDEHDHGPVDPHVWLDPTEAVAQIERILDAFIAADPAGAGTYRDNAAALIQRLEALDGRFSAALRSCSHRAFVVNHSAFGHLAERYDLEQISISGLEPEAEPGARTVATIATRMKDLGIRHVLAEPIASSRTAETIAREIGGEVLILHPLGVLTPDEARAGEDYFSIMEANLHILTTALACPTP